MRTVSVSELKARLTYYLREVRRGGEILVLDRGVPVARLTQPRAPAARDDERRERPARACVIRTGTGSVAAVLRARPLHLGVSLSDAVRAGRDGRD